MALNKRCDIAVPQSADQIAFPVARDRMVVDARRSFTDGYGVLDLAEPVLFHARMPGADRAFCPQVLEKLAFQDITRLDVQAVIDRLV